MPVPPDRIASPHFLLLWSSSFSFVAAFELGIATGAVGFGAVLARSSSPVMFLTAAAVARTGSTLAVTRWKR